MSDRGYRLVRVPRRWVPDWLWRLACRTLPAKVVEALLSEHDTERCECPCHEMPGMRECPWCGAVR